MSRIAELMLEAGRARAAGDLNAGQAWGQGLVRLGDLLGRSVQQYAEMRRDEPMRQANLTAAQNQNAITDIQLQEARRGQQSRSALSDAIASTPHVDENGVSLYDIPAISQKLEAAGYADHVGDIATQLKGINDAFRAESQAKLATVQRGAQALLQAGGDADLTLNFIDTLDKNHSWPSAQLNQFRAVITADPSKTAAILQQFAGPAKITMAAPGSTPVNELTGKPAGETLPDRTKQPTEASLAAAAAGGDAQAAAALDLLKPTKPGTIEDFVSRARRMAITKQGGQALTDEQQSAVDAQAMQVFRTVNADPEMRAATMALRAAALATKDPTSAINQEKLENNYRTVLQRTLSSRSGGMGLEDQKVNQANHLLAIFDQSKDPKTGEYKIPAVMLNELALGLARLTSPNGQVGVELMRELNQKTAAGKVADVLTYITGKPVTGNTQAVITMFRDSIIRQGQIAEANRDTYLDAIRMMAPTDLEESRRTKIEGGLTLNSLPIPVTVQTPSGAFTFPNKQKADAFKREAGLP